jgi:hypothetical protein
LVSKRHPQKVKTGSLVSSERMIEREIQIQEQFSSSDSNDEYVNDSLSSHGRRGVTKKATDLQVVDNFEEIVENTGE